MKRILTPIGTIEIRTKNGRVIRVNLPKNPRLFNCRYKYEDLANLVPDLSIGTPFQQKVWRYIRKIPYGHRVTYKNIADDLKLGRAYRAVGQACRSNPMPIVVPCHRVISSNGALGGYSWGARWKKFLLELEKDRI